MKNKTNIYLDIETTGLNPYYGDRVTAICAISDEGKEFKAVMKKSLQQDSEENKLLYMFFDWMMQFKEEDYKLVTQNGKRFDLPFLCARSVITGNEPMTFLFDFEHFDLIEIGDKWISLNNMAKLYGLPTKTSNGFEAIKMWNDGRHEELLNYCMHDVRLTKMVYEKYIWMKNE